MNNKERIVTALNLGIPDRVPTFELEFQIAREMFGISLITPEVSWENLLSYGELEREKALYACAERFYKVYTALDYSIIPAYGPGHKRDEKGNVHQYYKTWLKYLNEMFEGKVLYALHGDGTFGIPDGNAMYEFAYRLVDDLDGVKEEARLWALATIERNKRTQEAGIDTLFLCSDYCYNNGPFVSPDMFAQIVTPYLAMIIKAAREDGLYTIKHTDGDIMPILDQLVSTNPHALHSIDPMAGVDIKKVKEITRGKVALCGNVHCAALQTGTEQDIIDSAEYCLTHAKPGGGYVFCTSNIPFRGLPPERYQLCLDVWKRMRDY